MSGCERNQPSTSSRSRRTARITKSASGVGSSTILGAVWPTSPRAWTAATPFEAYLHLGSPVSIIQGSLRHETHPAPPQHLLAAPRFPNTTHDPHAPTAANPR